MAMQGVAFRVGSMSGPVRRMITWDGNPNDAVPSMVAQTDVASIFTNYPSAVSTSMTVMVISDSGYVHARALGFTDIIDLRLYSQNSPLELYISETRFIRMYKTNDDKFYRAYIKDNVVIFSALPGANYLVDAVFTAVCSAPTLSYAGIGWRLWGWVDQYTTNGYAYADKCSPTDNPTLYNELVEFYQGVTPPTPSDYNPYEENGTTEPGGGGGIGYENMPNDPVDFPTALSITASNANFISIWTPTLDQVQSLAAWLWTTDPIKVAFWQKLLQNPLELIFSLAILPVPIHHTDDPSEPVEEEIAHIDSLSLGWQDTGLPMDWIDKQYVTVDMGTIEMEEVWGAFLDYEPYTKIDIFLPYIGTKHLDTNDCMPRNISLKYIIDLATGTCLALIKCDDSVYYHFSGNCASQIPITVNQCQEIVRGLMTMAVGAATFAVGGAVGAGAHASKSAITKGAAMKAGGAAMVGSGADNAAKGVNVSRSGTISCAAGLMDVQTPYLIISRPKQAMPEEQNKYTGYPSFITRELSELEGYTEVQIIHLEEIPCTENELREIDELLVAGVIL